MGKVIDLSTVYSADDLFDLLGENMELPEYFGRNLDAFHDVLMEIGPRHPLELDFVGFEDGEAVLGKFIRNFRKLCEKAQQENSSLTFTFE